MVEATGFLPGLSPVCGKPVQVAFDGGRLSSDAGVLLLAEVARKLGIAERLARCVADPRAPEQIEHSVAEMIRFRALAIAAGYPDANDCDALRVNAARSFLICAEVKFPRQSSVSISRPADREHAFLAADRGVAAALSGTVA